MKEKVLVTGSNGQLGSCIKMLVNGDDRYIFTTKEEINISDYSSVDDFLNNNTDVKIIINCAAYTDVKGAETEEGYIKAKSVNVIGASNLAMACSERDIFLIHIGTDYVYGGELYNDIRTPIEENMFFNKQEMVDGLNKYALTKLSGINDIFRIMGNNFIIIISSWLYSEYGKNFVKTIYNKIGEGKDIEVVNTQIGSPTYAVDLARFIIDCCSGGYKEITNIFSERKFNNHIIHFSNLGTASWYDLAKAVEDLYGDSNLVKPRKNGFDDINRPSYSVLSTEKLTKIFGYEKPYIRHWFSALQECIKKIKEE